MQLNDLNTLKITEIADQFVKRACNVTQTCKSFSISTVTWYSWIKANDEFAKAIEAAKESLIELAESQLFKNIMNGKEVSLIFFLKNKKPNQWFDRKHVEINGNLNVTWADLAKDAETK